MQKVGQINDLSDFKIQATPDEHYLDKVHPGLDAKFERQGVEFGLKVSKVYPEVQGGQFKIDFHFEGERPDNIWSGQTYYINLELGQPVQALLIPRGAFYQSTEAVGYSSCRQTVKKLSDAKSRSDGKIRSSTK